MQNPIITGAMFKHMLQSAAQAMKAQETKVNELNVFPVPDGDTGSNMARTMSACALAVSSVDGDDDIGQVIQTAATALLRGARGNSGVILSIWMRGMSLVLKDQKKADGIAIAEALISGMEAAYKAVMKPVEGTILTVAKDAASAAVSQAKQSNDAEEVLGAAVMQAKATLSRTPDMLPVLKKAGVVDSGGQGLVIILSTMLAVLEGTEEKLETVGEPSWPVGETYEQEEKSIYPYCTELIVNKDAGGKGHDPLTLRAFLESLGDCVLVADDTDFIKVHCHTDHPGKVIEEALNFGFLTDIKIDNMRIQSQQKSDTPIKQMGFVAVASGEGICETFKDLGVDAVVEGGQTMNPSTEDILRAIESVPAQTVFVLPNNKNIIMAAEQAASLSGGKGRVLHTKTVPQGMSAMLAYLPNASVDENMLAMEGASRQVHTGMITYAVRNMDFGGKHIRVNETLALADGQLAFTDSDMVRAAEKLLKQMVDRSTAFITILYGEGASAKQAEYLHTRISAKYPKAEVNIINGGQPLYRFILSVE